MICKLQFVCDFFVHNFMPIWLKVNNYKKIYGQPISSISVDHKAKTKLHNKGNENQPWKVVKCAFERKQSKRSVIMRSSWGCDVRG